MKKIALSLFIGLLAIPALMWGQQNAYKQTNLVSNVSGVAHTTDSQLSNPWGVAFVAGQDFWIANNNGGTSTLYDAQGNKDMGLVVTIPGASHNPNGNCSPGCPTGVVANGNGSYFGGGQFIYDTEDGIFAVWTGASNTASVAFDNSASGAVYKGMAVLNGTFLLAANFNSGKVDVLDRNFTLTSLSGSFTDPHLAAGLAPHGISVIGNQVFVAYAMQDAAKHDSQPGAGLGQVDIFDSNGNFVSTFVAGGKLNAPWGIVAAPAGFGAFPNAILIGNFGDGTINAFDTTGKFLGQLSDSSGKALSNPGLWDLTFGGGGSSGDSGTLYITAGGSNQPNFPSGGSTTAVFASIVPAATVGSPDFSLSLSSQSATVAQGGSATVMVSASAVGGFNGPIALSCSAPAGLNCAFSSNSISPGSSTASSTLTIMAASTPPPTGYVVSAMSTLLPGFGVLGTVLVGRRKKLFTRKSVLWLSLALVILVSLFALGCGGGSSNKSMNPAGTQVNLMVTGTSGAISHSSVVAVTIQ
ncbi:MAG: TIGR03118 family protein [Acidobacteriaceae bacterium]|nr:TIGR03118 family protein [Acidobacteriaceae bacterium]